MRQSVLQNHTFNLNFLKMLVADIPDDQMCDQPAGVVNHPAWSMGHLCSAAQFGVMLTGGELSLPDGWPEQFGRVSTPTSDGTDYPTKSELLAEFERCHEQLTAAVAAADETTLAQQTPDPDFREIVPTVSDALVFLLVNHTALHLGQIITWRRAKGLGPVLG